MANDDTKDSVRDRIRKALIAQGAEGLANFFTICDDLANKIMDTTPDPGTVEMSTAEKTSLVLICQCMVGCILTDPRLVAGRLKQMQGAYEEAANAQNGLQQNAPSTTTKQ